MLFISKKDFRNLVEGLMSEMTLYGPVKKHGHPAYAEISSFDELVPGMTPTHLSAKEFFFPPKETLLNFDIEKKEVFPVIQSKRQAVIGLHSCDIHAIRLMDAVFSSSTKDPNYLARRENTLLIGTECLPDEYCFCKSIGTMTVQGGFDVFLHEVKKGYLARTGSKQGRRVLEKYTNPSPAKEAQLKELVSFKTKKDKKFARKINAEPSALPLIYSGADASPVWERIGNICYGCGSCNHVCPTCYCFDVKDDISPDMKKGARFRVWDGCTLEDFAKISGGHNFRKTRAERLRHRFNRKFRYLADRFKGLFCVGCGRCSRTCLVKINITDVTNEISEERAGLAVSAETEHS